MPGKPERFPSKTEGWDGCYTREFTIVSFCSFSIYTSTLFTTTYLGFYLSSTLCNSFISFLILASISYSIVKEHSELANSYIFSVWLVIVKLL
ncbi:hypothetical protein CW304_18870 [Bacillus sp. UFRGS-B20]|nr:hypothetical protein CW304_18870 [Bacillus sp. UFRGS-B20]